MRRGILFLVLAGLFSGFLGLAGIAGYAMHKYRLQPYYGLAERVDKRARRVMGVPSESAQALASLDSIFVQLKGTVHPMPGHSSERGGALALWVDDVLAMPKDGSVYVFEEGRGLVKTALTPPDNGLPAYRELAETEAFSNLNHDFERLRYNDLEYIETDERRGLVISYTFVDAENACFRTRLSWLDIPKSAKTIRDVASDPDDWSLLFESSPCLRFNEDGTAILGYMAGGRVAFKAPDTLYLGNGDYHQDGITRYDAGIQSMDSDYGKTIEINLDTGAARIFSRGHRNLQGVTLDAEGRLWVSEHGPRGGDELNLIVDGGNYGWPEDILGTLYTKVPIETRSGIGRHDDPAFRAPIYAWLPSAAVSSLALVDGFHEAWDGDILIGSLKAETLFRARIQDDRLVFMESIPLGVRIRDVMQVSSDRIALWLDPNELAFLEIVERADPLEGVEDLISPRVGADMARRVAQELANCNECHSFEKNVHGAGPSLHRITGRPIASSGFAGYSEALRSVPGRWQAEDLTAFLSDPDGFAPGTTMGVAVSDPDLAAALVTALEVLGEQQALTDVD